MTSWLHPTVNLFGGRCLFLAILHSTRDTREWAYTPVKFIFTKPVQYWHDRRSQLCCLKYRFEAEAWELSTKKWWWLLFLCKLIRSSLSSRSQTPPQTEFSPTVMTTRTPVVGMSFEFIGFWIYLWGNSVNNKRLFTYCVTAVINYANFGDQRNGRWTEL